MNPFRESDAPRVEYNKTEVELARIRETEETKRQIAVAREKSVQNRPDSYYVVRGLAVVAAFASTLAVSVAWYNVNADRVRAEHPAIGCVETAEVVTNTTSERACPNGGWFESTPTSQVGSVLIRCHCGSKPAAPAPSGSSAP